MSFLAIKNNPFPGLAEQWEEAVRRAPEVADRAAAAAAEVYADEIRERAGIFDRWDDNLTSQVKPYRAKGGIWQVGLPDATEEEAQRAMEAEYGDGTNKPQPLFRTAAERAREEALEVFNDLVHEGLFG